MHKGVLKNLFLIMTLMAIVLSLEVLAHAPLTAGENESLARATSVPDPVDPCLN